MKKHRKGKAAGPAAATLVTHLGRDPAQQQGVVNPPVYRASTIIFDSLDALEESGPQQFEKGKIHYGRLGTPTVFALEDAVAALEGGYGGIAMPSGLAAITGAIMAFVEAGDHVLIADHVYYPNRRFCMRILSQFGVEATFYDPRVAGGIADLIRPNTKVVFVESPGSLTFELQDIPAIAAAAHEKGAVVIADNTWATPLFCRPFDLGADVVVHAATKYIVGHADAMLGMIVVREAHYDRVRRFVKGLGHGVAPDDCYLALRGLRSLSVRLERHQANSLALAEWLLERPEVLQVMHPALPGFPGHEVWLRDFAGASGLFGFTTRRYGRQALSAMLDNMKLFSMGYSWGGFESLLLPTQPEQSRSATDWPDDVQAFRIHAGLEDAADLIADLEAGFARLTQT